MPTDSLREWAERIDAALGRSHAHFTPTERRVIRKIVGTELAEFRRAVLKEAREHCATWMGGGATDGEILERLDRLSREDNNG